MKLPSAFLKVSTATTRSSICHQASNSWVCKTVGLTKYFERMTNRIWAILSLSTNQPTNQCPVTDSYYRETRYVVLNQKRFLRILVREANAWIAVNASRKKIKHCLACRSQMLTFDWIDNRNGSKMIVGRNDTQRQLRSCTAANCLIASSKVFREPTLRKPSMEETDLTATWRH